MKILAIEFSSSERSVAVLEDNGAGELILNSIDKDGTMTGYDTELVRTIYSKLSIPLTVLGGAGSLSHVKELIDDFGIVGAAAGSIFVFKGKYRAVLIQYPSSEQKKSLITSTIGTERNA